MISNNLDIEYADHLYDSKKIKNYDKLIFTEQIEPLENLLNL